MSDSPLRDAMERPSRPHNAERICVVWFENREGYAIVAPDQSHPCPEGFERREARTLAEIDTLTRRVNRQDTDKFSRLFARDRDAMKRKHTEIRQKLGQRALSVDCGPLEQLFIRRMFAYLERKEREMFDFEVRGYFVQREMDSKSAGITDYGSQVKAPRLSERLASLLGTSS